MPRPHHPARFGLIALNVALLGALAVVTFQPAARAGGEQPATNRPRGQYVVTAGRMQGSSAHAIYILDVVNQELAAMEWDHSAQKLSVIGYRNVAMDQGGSKGR